MSLGDLQSEILGVLQRVGKTSAREIMMEISGGKKLAYTTVSTVLDRLYRKGFVKRVKVSGKGGVRYLYSYAATPRAKLSLVRRTIGGLVSAFGPSIVPMIYENLEHLSDEEKTELKKKLRNRR